MLEDFVTFKLMLCFISCSTFQPFIYRHSVRDMENTLRAEGKWAVDLNDAFK